MPKTEVILTHNVIGLGAESDHVKVAAGFARNYLFPQGFAIPLTSANKRQIEALRKRRGEREAKELNTMTELATTLSKLTLVIKVKTGEDGKMFGSVTAGTIADELHHHYDAHLDKRKIQLAQPIKTLGDHDVPLHLHHDVNCTLKVKVESSTPLSPEVQAALAAQKAPAVKEDAKDAKPKTEKRGGRPEKGEVKEGKDSKEKGEKPAKTEKSSKPAGKGDKTDKKAKAPAA